MSEHAVPYGIEDDVFFVKHTALPAGYAALETIVRLVVVDCDIGYGKVLFTRISED